jgi:hypothetical protein
MPSRRHTTFGCNPGGGPPAAAPPGRGAGFSSDDASRQTTVPIRLPSMFSSELHAKTRLPSTTTDAFSPRLLTGNDHAFLPVRAWNAVTEPSPAPVTTRRSPLMTLITGVL